MPANFSPLRADHGFKSPGFEVDSIGNIIAEGNAEVYGNITIVGELSAGKINFEGVQLLETDDSTVSLSSAISHSSLRTLGRLMFLETDGDISMYDNTDLILSIESGVVTVNSNGGTGTIDGIDIGQTTPGLATFTNATIGSEETSGVLTVSGSVVVSTSIESDSLNTTDLTTTNVEADDITINNTPVEPYHSTRKDYVDNRITALSIALGA